MAVQHNTMVSGSPDKLLLDKYLELVRDTDMITLREISKINSNMINTLVNPHSKTPNADQIDELFTYIPNIFTSDSGNSRLLRSNTQDPNIVSETADFLEQLRLELDSLELDKSRNPYKVHTQWLLESNIQKTHRDLKNADDLGKFPNICKLRDRINTHEECKGSLNACIIICYQSVSSRFRPHSDDEPYINQDASICTLPSMRR